MDELSQDQWIRITEKDELAIDVENHNDNKSSENGDFSEINSKNWGIFILLMKITILFLLTSIKL